MLLAAVSGDATTAAEPVAFLDGGANEQAAPVVGASTAARAGPALGLPRRTRLDDGVLPRPRGEQPVAFLMLRR